MTDRNDDEPRSWTDEQLLLTAEQAARALHVGRRTLFALIKNGELHAVHIGRSCRLTRAELVRYVVRLDRPASPSRLTRSTSTQGGRTSANQGGLFDLDPTPPEAVNTCDVSDPRRTIEQELKESAMAERTTAGEATVYKDEHGRWHSWITVGLKRNGERDRRHRSGKTRKEVVEKIRELEVTRETGQMSAVTSDTVTGWLEHWLTNIAARRVRPRTLESYESMIRMHISPGIGRHRLDRLQPEHLEHFYSDLLDEGQSAATVLRAHRIISRALKVAMQRGRVHRNVAALVDPPAQRRSEAATALDLDETRAELAAATGLGNAAGWTVALALALGLRQSEALALRWRDIDLLNNTLSVRRTLHRVKRGGMIYEAPKTKRSERTLAPPMPLVAALHTHKAAQLGERMLAGWEWRGDDGETGVVFAQANGRPIDKKSDYDDWCRLLERAGVRHVRLHDGRHTAARLEEQ